MLEAFKPNGSVTGRAWTILLIVETALFLFLWSLGDAYSIPGPLDVFTTLGKLVREEGLLYELIFVSLRLNLEAILISATISISLAWLTVLPVLRPVAYVISKARFLSLSGFITLLTLMFGGGHGIKLSLLTFGMTVFFLTSMMAVVAEIPKAEWDQARTLRMSPWRSVVENVILGRVDACFEMLRQNAAIGWMMLTMVEGLSRTEGGVGALMVNSTRYRHFDAMFALQATVFVIGILQDQGLAYLKNLFCPYAAMTLERK